jgi:hypothetical protein
MRSQPNAFPRPLDCVQIVRRHLRWSKEEKGEVQLKKWLPYPKEMNLIAFVDDGRLYLSEALAENFDPEGIQWLIIFQDGLADASQLHGLQGNQSLSLPPLKFNLEDEKTLIHFHWDYFHVGDPSRDDMKIASLSPGKNLEFKINGKRDFSLTDRRPRSYLEQDFLIVNHGTVQTWQVMDSAFVNRKIGIDKTIDLRKLLW